MGKITVKTTLPKRSYPAPPARSIIETSRLIISPATVAHEAEIHSLRTHEEVMVWSAAGHVDADIEATRKSMSAWLPPKDVQTWNWVVHVKETGSFVGIVGNYSRVGNQGWPELGYMLMKEHWGKGYATEALKAVLPTWWALEREETEIEVDEDTVVVGGVTGTKVESGTTVEEVFAAVIDMKNDRSANILGKFGFQRVKRWYEEANGRIYDLGAFVQLGKDA